METMDNAVLFAYAWLQTQFERARSNMERGQGAVEYTIIVAVVAIVVAGLARDPMTKILNDAVTSMGGKVTAAFGKIT